MKTIRLSLLCLGALTACVESNTTSGGFLREVPPEVVAMAAPNQNLNAVKVLEEDGCFWYQHVGPVETTMLPLLSTRGRPICTAREEETPAAT